MSEFEFKCKEPGCDKTIKYEREDKPVYAGINLKKKKTVMKKVMVYLRCEKNHWNSYEIEIEGPDKGTTVWRKC